MVPVDETVPAWPPRGLRVLLADDERAIAITLGDALREAGHRVTVVREGMAAVLALEEMEFDAVLSDLRIPGRDGMEILRRTRALQPRAAFLLLTGHATAGTEAEALSGGAARVLRKPFYNEEVLRILEGLRRGPAVA